MRNNEERFGAIEQTTDPTPVIEKTEQFAYITPTEAVEIPSKGILYPPEHPLYMQDTIEIRHMTAKDEDTLTSKALLKKGLAVDKMLNDIIVDKRIKVDNLLIGDKNALIVAARISGYGEEYETKITCPSCGVSSQHTFDLNINTMAYPLPKEELDNLGIITTEKNTFIVRLPLSKIEVEIKLLTGLDERQMVVKSQEQQKNNLPESTMTQQMKYFIVSMNGETDRRKLTQMVENIPAKDSKYLRTVYKNINPNIELEQNFVCSACEFEDSMEVPFTSDFFWPKR
jgi:hypothetical protein